MTGLDANAIVIREIRHSFTSHTIAITHVRLSTEILSLPAQVTHILELSGNISGFVYTIHTIPRVVCSDERLRGGCFVKRAAADRN